MAGASANIDEGPSTRSKLSTSQHQTKVKVEPTAKDGGMGHRWGRGGVSRLLGCRYTLMATPSVMYNAVAMDTHLMDGIVG
uniref:Uncharacterized protein n=1 Tax=Oryza barthii TaxID=65489 RepID=A0A0D3HTF4_9ORYZ